MNTQAAVPRATIAISVYNSAPTLSRCLHSAAEQTLRDIEIIAVDDGSTDDSAAVIAAFAARDARVRLIRLAHNQGKAHAMNLMMQQARGTWFAVLDADDAYRPPRLETLIGMAESDGSEAAADNIAYLDRAAGCEIRTAFDPSHINRLVTKADLPANSSSFASFDYGILKPVVQRCFALRHGLNYLPGTKLAEDFYYLMELLVAGGRMSLCSQPMYEWSMPFGPISRQWSGTGSGAWRYDYRNALSANAVYLGRMEALGETEMAQMLRKRARQYGSMIHYIDAQKNAAEGHMAAALLGIARHPSTYRLLGGRLLGRARGMLRNATSMRPATMAGTA